MLEVLLGLALAGLGFFAGWKAAAGRKPRLPQPRQQELTRLREEQAAFEALMGYSQRQAYGQEEFDGA